MEKENRAISLEGASVRSLISLWIDRTFSLACRGDRMVINEHLYYDKEGNEWLELIFEFKKPSEWLEVWTSDEYRDRWQLEIRTLLRGDVMKLNLDLSESMQNKYICGWSLDKNNEEIPVENKGRLQNYQFKLEVTLRSRVKKQTLGKEAKDNG